VVEVAGDLRLERPQVECLLDRPLAEVAVGVLRPVRRPAACHQAECLPVEAAVGDLLLDRPPAACLPGLRPAVVVAGDLLPDRLPAACLPGLRLAAVAVGDLLRDRLPAACPPGLLLVVAAVGDLLLGIPARRVGRRLPLVPLQGTDRLRAEARSAVDSLRLQAARCRAPPLFGRQARRGASPLRW
jgi:hypothetical protein